MPRAALLPPDAVLAKPTALLLMPVTVTVLLRPIALLLLAAALLPKPTALLLFQVLPDNTGFVPAINEVAPEVLSAPPPVMVAPPQPEDGRVEVEVATEAAGDTGEHLVGRAALEARDLGRGCGVFIHGSSMPCGG